MILGTIPADSFVVDSYPRGYDRMTTSLDCDANIAICRKYGLLHDRILLHLQAELSRLELDLECIDDAQAKGVHFEERRGLWCDLLANLGERKHLQR